MPNVYAIIDRTYLAFNRRDIKSALEVMSDDVDWPKASEGGRVIGKEAITSYWTRQWAEFDPHVEPIEVIERQPGIIEVRVHQVVKDLKGKVISDQTVVHVYTFANGLIERMDIAEGEPAFGQSYGSRPE